MAGARSCMRTAPRNDSMLPCPIDFTYFKNSLLQPNMCECHKNHHSQSTVSCLLKSHQVIPSLSSKHWRVGYKQRTAHCCEKSNFRQGAIRQVENPHVDISMPEVLLAEESAPLGPPCALNTLILPPCGHRPFSVTAPREREKMHDP